MYQTPGMRIATSPPGRMISLVGTELSVPTHIYITKTRLRPLLRSTRSHALPSFRAPARTVDRQTPRTRSAHKTIKSYLTGLKSLHIDLGLSTEPFGNHPLQRIIRGINRFHGKPNRMERLPITRGLLIRILSLLDANNPCDLNLYGAFRITHAGFLRGGEITCTGNDLIDGHTEFAQWNCTRRSIQFEEDRVLLTLPSSKTDPFRKGVTITLSASSDAACPVMAMRHLYEHCPSWNPLAAIFTRPLGDGPGSKAFTQEYLV
jgi:hypothetical protein